MLRSQRNRLAISMHYGTYDWHTWVTADSSQTLIHFDLSVVSFNRREIGAYQWRGSWEYPQTDTAYCTPQLCRSSCIPWISFLITYPMSSFLLFPCTRNISLSSGTADDNRCRSARNELNQILAHSVRISCFIIGWRSIILRLSNKTSY